MPSVLDMPPRRIVVVMPTWLGDCVMATPTLRAIRQVYPDAHIAALIHRSLKSMLEGMPWLDRIVSRPESADASARHRQKGMLREAVRLGAGHFDTAILLPNSFRSAMLVKLAGIPRRIGYAREGRNILLTHMLKPLRKNGKYVPVPTRDYYLNIARSLGAEVSDKRMELFTRPQDDEAGRALLSEAGGDLEAGQRLVLLNPGANFGEAKMWFAERFAAVADCCVEQLGAVVAVTGAPKERAILDSVIAAAQHPIIDLPKRGLNLHLLKSITKLASVMVTNDTGPRHIAAAFDTPVVTVFGPTNPDWTTIDFDDERIVRIDVPCGPCQQKVCPLTGQADELICMKGVTSDMVFERVRELWEASA